MAEEGQSAQDTSPLSVTVSCCSAIAPVTTVTMATTELTATGTGTIEIVDCTIVPVGWKRSVQAGAVKYISPSNHMLHSEAEVRQYLLMDGTCKCGLECPLVVTRVFNFDPKVPSRCRTVQEATGDGALTKLCNHKRKVIAMSVLQQSGVHGPVTSRGCVVHSSSMSPDSVPPVNTPNSSTKQGKKRARGRPKTKPQDKMIELQHHQNLSVSQLLALRGADSTRQAMIFNQVSPPYPPLEHMHSIDLYQQHQLQLHLMRIQQQQHMQQQLQLQMQHQHFQHQQGISGRHPSGGMPPGGMAPPKSPLNCNPPPISPMHSPTMPPHRSPLSRHGTPSPAHSSNYCKSPAHSDLSSPSPGLITPKEGFFPPGVAFGQHMSEISPEITGHTPSVIPLASNVLHPSNRGSMPNTQTVCSSHTSPHSHIASPEHGHSHVVSPEQNRLHDGVNLIHPSHLSVGPIPDPQMRYLPEDVRATLAVSRLAGLPEKQTRIEQLAHQEHCKMAQSLEEVSSPKSVQNRTILKQKKPQSMPSMEQILGPPDAGAFPASTLLTAAANAQLANQAQHKPTSLQGTNQGPVLSKMGLLMNNNNSSVGEFNPMLHLSQVGARLPPCAIPNKNTSSRKRKSPASKPNSSAKSICELYEECAPENTTQDFVVQCEGSTSPHPAKRKASSSSAKSPIECLESTVQNIETISNPELDNAVEVSSQLHSLQDPNHSELYVQTGVISQQIPLNTAHEDMQVEAAGSTTAAKKITTLEQDKICDDTKPSVTLTTEEKSTISATHDSTSTTQNNPMLQNQEAVLPFGVPLTEEEKAKQEQEWYLSMIKNTAHLTNMGVDPLLQHLGMGAFTGHGNLLSPNVAQYRQALLGVGTGVGGSGIMQGNPSMQSLIGAATQSDVTASGHGINELAQVAATIDKRHPKRSRVETLAQAQNALGLQHRIDLLKNPDAIIQGFQTALHQQQDVAILQMLLQQQQQHQQMTNFHAQNALQIPPNQTNMPSSMETLAAVAAAQQSANISRTAQQYTNVARTADQQTKRKRSKSKSGRDDPPYKCASRSKSPSRASGVRKVKDILAEARSARQFAESSGQVDAIYQAVVDSASSGVKVMIAPGEIDSGRVIPSEGSKNLQGQAADSDTINVNKNVPVPPVVPLSSESGEISGDQVDKCVDGNSSNKCDQDCDPISQASTSNCQHIVMPLTSKTSFIVPVQHVVTSQYSSDAIHKVVKSSPKSGVCCNKLIQGNSQLNLLGKSSSSSVSQELKTVESPCLQLTPISDAPIAAHHSQNPASCDVKYTQDLVETEHNSGQSTQALDVESTELSPANQTCNYNRQCKPCDESNEVVTSLPSDEESHSHHSFQTGSMELQQELKCQEETEQHSDINIQKMVLVSESANENIDSFTKLVDEPVPAGEEEERAEQTNLQCNIQTLRTPENESKEAGQSTQTKDIMAPNKNMKSEQSEQSLSADDSTQTKDMVVSKIKSSEDSTTFKNSEQSLKKNAKKDVHQNMNQISCDAVKKANSTDTIVGSQNADVIQVTTTEPEATPKQQKRDDKGYLFESIGLDVAGSSNLSSQIPINERSDFVTDIPIKGTVPHSAVNTETISNSGTVISKATFVSAVAADNVAISPGRSIYLEETSDVVPKSDTNIKELIKGTIYDQTNDLSLQTQPALKLGGTRVILDSKTKCNVDQRVESTESVSLFDGQKISGNMLLESECECDFKEERTTSISKECETKIEVDDNSRSPDNPQSPSTHVVMCGSILNLPSSSTLITMASDHTKGAVQKLSSVLQHDVHVSEKSESLTLAIPISDNTCTQDTALEPILSSHSQSDISDKESLIQAVSESDNTNTLESAAEKTLSSPSEQDVSEEGTSTPAISFFDNTRKQVTVAEKIPLLPSLQDVSAKESSTQIMLVSGNTRKQDNSMEHLPSLVSQKCLCKKESSPQAILVADNIRTQKSTATQIHLSTLHQCVSEKEESLQIQTNPVKSLQVSTVCNPNFDKEDMFSNVRFDPAPGLSDQDLLASEIPSQCEMTLATDELPRDTEGTSVDTASDKTAGYPGLGTENQQVEHYAIQNQESERLLQEDMNTSETAAIHMNNSNSNSAGACVIQDLKTGLSDDILSVDKNSLEKSPEDSESRFLCKPLEISTAEKFMHLSSHTTCADFNIASTPKKMETVEMENKSVCSSSVRSNMETESNSGAVQLEMVQFKSGSKLADSVEMSALVSNSVSVAMNPQRTQEFPVNASLPILEPKSKVEASDCKPTETCLHSDSNDSLCNHILSRTISEADASIGNSKSSENSSFCSIDETAFISSAHQIEGCPVDIAAVDSEMGDIAATCKPHILDEKNTGKTTNRLELPLSTNVHNNSSGVDFLTKPEVKTTVEITNKHNRSLKLPKMIDVMLSNQSILMPAECENDTDVVETHLTKEMSMPIVGGIISKTPCELTKDTKEYPSMDIENVSVNTSISFCKTSTSVIGTFGTPVELITSSTVSSIPLDGKVVTEFNLSKHVSDSTQACILRNNVENAIKLAQTISTEKRCISKPGDVTESIDDKAEELPLNTHVVGDYKINSDIEESFIAVEVEDISSKQGKNQNKQLSLTIKPTEHKIQDSTKIQDATNNVESSNEQERNSDACLSPTNHNTFTSNLCDNSNPNTSGETNMNNQDTECVISACENRKIKDNPHHIEEFKKDQNMPISETCQNTPSVQSTISSQLTEGQTMHLAPKEGCMEKATEKQNQTFTLSRSCTEHNNDCEQLAQEPSGLKNTSIDDLMQGIEESKRNHDLQTEQEHLTYNKKVDCESMMTESEVNNMDAESMMEETSPIEEASFNHNDIMVSDQETNACSLIGSSTKQLSLGKSSEPLLLDTSEFAVKKNYKCEITENGNNVYPEELTINMQTPGTEGIVPAGSDYYLTRDGASSDGGNHDVANEQSVTCNILPELKAASRTGSTETATVVCNDETITDGYMEIPNDIDCNTTSHTVGPTLRSESKENITPDKKDPNEHSRVKEDIGKTEMDVCHSSHDDVLEEMADNSDTQDKDSQATDDPESPEPIEVTATIQQEFETGDLVWGQIRGYPSWPGKLVSDSDIRGTARRETGRGSKREEGKVWVMWFGDHSYTQVEPGKLKTLSEGLEAHHRARKRNRRGRKMNSGLESAIQEAMLELDKQTELAGKEGNPVSSKSLCYKPKTKRKRLR